jgi:carbon monoxide dehydrogenase subunit G
MADVEASIHIEATPEQVFDLFNDPDTFVDIIGHLQDADREGDDIEWVAQGPLGIKLSGEAKIVEEERPSALTWESTGGALDVRGSAHFEPEDEGTLLSYSLSYDVLGDAAAKAVAGALGDAEGEVERALKRLKELAEN